MNSSSPTAYNSSDPSAFGGYAYAMGVSFGVLILIITTTLASYFCTRMAQEPSNSTITHQANSITDQQYSITVELGLDEATLGSYPQLLYSQAKLHKGDSLASCCSICLGDYKDTDMLRLLPHCDHIFHLQCVDSWLRLHTTCPICRNSPVPTPLAEVAPLAAQRY